MRDDERVLLPPSSGPLLINLSIGHMTTSLKGPRIAQDAAPAAVL